MWIKNQTGLTLVEALISVTIGSVGVLAISHALQSISKYTQSAQSTKNWENQLHYLNMALRDPTTCLTAIKAGKSKIANNFDSSALTLPQLSKNTSAYFFKTGAKTSGILTNSIKLEAVPNVSPTTISLAEGVQTKRKVSLNLSVTKEDGTPATTGLNHPESELVLLDLYQVQSEIVGCNSSIDYASEFCRSIEGKTSFDSAQRKCQLNKLSIVNGESKPYLSFGEPSSVNAGKIFFDPLLLSLNLGSASDTSNPVWKIAEDGVTTKGAMSSKAGMTLERGIQLGKNSSNTNTVTGSAEFKGTTYVKGSLKINSKPIERGGVYDCEWVTAFNSATVDCPSGKKVVAGGAKCKDTRNIAHSRPGENTSIWYVRCTHDDNERRYWWNVGTPSRVNALCCRRD